MPEIRMRHWKARTAFGEKKVDLVLSDPRWKEQYPELYRQLESPDKRVRFFAILPEPIVLEMAKDGIFVYRADEDGERLYYCGYRDALKTRVGRFLSALDALQEYGSECVFESTDKSVGYKAMTDTFYKT